MAAYTYPGVYIQELPSAVHTITGVATSIAAFVGWTNQGPTNKAVLVQSWTDYQTQFGGLVAGSYLGYAVNQFFGNGGQQAYVVRVVWDGTLDSAPNTAPVPAATAFATGIGLATSVITAAFEGLSGSSALTVGSPVLESIAITPSAPPSLTVGQTLQLTATGAYSDGSTEDLTATVNWSSSNPTLATVGKNTGVAVAVATGATVITATFGVVAATIELSVTAATLSGIVVTPASATVATGETLQLSATGSYSDATTQDLTAFVTWVSSATSTAKFGVPTTAPLAGLVEGVAEGSANITAAWSTVTSPAVPLSVTAPALESIALSPVNPTITSGDPLSITATGTFSSGPAEVLSGVTAPVWSSSNDGVATVDALGKVTTTGLGTAAITATSGSVTKSTTVTVTEATLSSISIAPTAGSFAAGLSLQLTAIGTYSDGTTADLTGAATWSSALANFTVAMGLATGTAPAAGSVTATWAGVSSNASITVTPPLPKSIVVTPNPADVSGPTQQFAAAATLTDGTSVDVTAAATWTSSSPPVATMSTTTPGLASIVSGGDTLTLFAANPGAWANNIQVSVALQSSNKSRFSITVINGTTGATLEYFPNLSTSATDPQYVVTVIDTDSNYVTFVNPATGNAIVPSGPPAATVAPISLAGGVDGTVLQPASDGNFETALGSDPSASFNYGVHLLDRVDIFNLLCVPGETDQATIQDLQKYCSDERAFYIVDCPQSATTAGLTSTGPVGTVLGGGTVPTGQLSGQYSINSAYYFPWVSAPDPLFGNRAKLFPPCGFVAGIYATTDASRGVWKAPAGIDASLTGNSGLQYVLTNQENGSLNPQAINCLRQFKVYGDVVWGARTLQGSDEAGSQWKYIPIKRLALFIESSLYDGTQWVVFEPNAEPLWGQIRLNVGTFMQGLFLQGAFQGSTPQQAYFVKCDSENNPQSSINQSIVNILVGFAPLYPAEFVVIQIQQISDLIPS